MAGTEEGVRAGIVPRGGALFDCDGIVRKNWFEGNYADAAGGAAADCDGTVVQNFFYKNHTSVFGGGLSGCNGHIISNVFYDNSCSSGNGGAMRDCDAVRIEQNTIFKNFVYSSGNRAGGIADTLVTGNFRNNILWGNTKNGPPGTGTSAQLYNSPGIEYSAIDQTPDPNPGNNNIGAFDVPPKNPQFVSTTYVPPVTFEDTFTGDGLGSSWNVVAGAWTDKTDVGSNGNYYLSHTKSPTVYNQIQVLNQPVENRHVWFSYYRESDSDPGKEFRAIFRWYSWSDYAYVEVSDTTISLKQVEAGGAAETLESVPRTSAKQVWYDVTIIADGTSAQVWWAKRGDPTELLFQSTGVSQELSTRFFVWVRPNGHYRFDDVMWQAPANLHEFLKLKVVATDPLHPEDFILNSPCLDRTDPNPIAYAPFNDFDDHMGPLNAPDVGLVGEPPNPPVRDMGALEWRAAADAVYWWENF